ncbi:MAG: FkbM family methyltransferase [Gammaproteobacteria bacterium]|nr:FkbM family methyltransferase [Gammaproteobacteria bacterium]
MIMRRLLRKLGISSGGKPNVAVPAAPEDGFLKACRGVLHIGANSGQERETYARLRLPVIWFEALPQVFAELQANIAPFPDQVAICALLADQDGQKHLFRVASNNGASSSILEFKHHKDIWPDVEYVDSIEMESATLPTVLAAHGVDLSRYDALVMDTQGSEQLILQGAGSVLDGIRFIKTEAADFESYENCATVASLTAFLEARGFRLLRKDRFATHPTLGAYYDVLFERSARTPAVDS